MTYVIANENCVDNDTTLDNYCKFYILGLCDISEEMPVGYVEP